MIEVLRHTNHLDNLNCADSQAPNYNGKRYQDKMLDLRHLYDAVLAYAEVANPIGRVRDYSDDVWRFRAQAGMPFTNNLAEQTVRMPKVKQKVSGCFRTLEGAQAYRVIRSYCATMHKQGANVVESLVAVFQNAPPRP